MRDTRPPWPFRDLNDDVKRELRDRFKLPRPDKKPRGDDKEFWRRMLKEAFRPSR